MWRVGQASQVAVPRRVTKSRGSAVKEDSADCPSPPPFEFHPLPTSRGLPRRDGCPTSFLGNGFSLRAGSHPHMREPRVEGWGMGLPAQAAPTSQKAQDFQSHFPCHWIPSPTRLLLFPAAPLRPPLGREERLVGPPWNSKPFPGQQKQGLDALGLWPRHTL